MNVQLDNSNDWRSLYPFESNFIGIDGQRMHYIDQCEGSEDSRKNADPVVMVHGNPTWSFYYRGLIRKLAGNFRAIAVDHIGCGLSDKPTRYNYTLSQHRDNLVALLDQLDLRNATLVAHDWGGAIGLAALLARRDRFKRIVLFNTGAFPPPYIPYRIRICRWPIVGRFGVQGLNLFARAANSMATERVGGLPRNVAAGMLAPYNNWKNRTAIYQFVRDIPQGKAHPTWEVLEQIENQLPELGQMPIKLIWGMKDWCFRPVCLDRFRDHWPNADVTEIADAGHYVVEDAADQVEQLVEDFLLNH